MMSSTLPLTSARQFLPPAQNCLICRHAVAVVENSEKNRKMCEIFCSVACRYLDFKSGHFRPDRTINVNSVININNRDNCNILCDNCFPLAESFCKIYNEFQYLEQLFHWRMKKSIDNIRIQMEKGLHDHDDVDDDDEAERKGQELNQENRSRSQIEFRQKFVMRGKQKLFGGVPIVQLDRQGLDRDAETSETKIIINIVKSESLEMPESDFLRDPLEIETEEEFLEIHDDEGQSLGHISYWCEVCKKEFTRISEFRHHRNSCHSEPVGVGGRNTGLRRKNMNEDNSGDDGKSNDADSNSKTHCCKICGKSFPHLYRLRIHERLHTGAKPYKCRFCEQTFALALYRDRHEQRHTGVRPYECAICGQTYRHSNTLNVHGKSKHPGEKFRSEKKSKYSESSFKCGFCRKVFGNMKHKLIHEQSHSISKVDPVANYELSGKQKLVEAVPTLPLPLDTQAFGINARKTKIIINLQESQSSQIPEPGGHNSEDAANPDSGRKCKICGKSFPQLYRLRVHERLHTGAKPYKCRFCEQTFALPLYRERHERRHTGARPYECTICGQKYRHSNTLNIHGKSKHPGEKFRRERKSKYSKTSFNFNCSFCGKVFGTLKHKLIHERSHSRATVDPVTDTVVTKNAEELPYDAAVESAEGDVDVDEDRV